MKEEMRVGTKQQRRSSLGLRVVGLGLLTLVVSSLVLTVQPTDARSLPLPTRPVFEPPTPGPGSGPSRPVGGWIEVQVHGVTDTSEWLDVQWKDSLGTWQTVESWHGQFDQVLNGVGTKTWWVSQYTFGPTPFRWVVYDSTGKNVLVTSQPFNLPTQNQQWVVVTVSFP